MNEWKVAIRDNAGSPGGKWLLRGGESGMGRGRDVRARGFASVDSGRKEGGKKKWQPLTALRKLRLGGKAENYTTLRASLARVIRIGEGKTRAEVRARVSVVGQLGPAGRERGPREMVDQSNEGNETLIPKWLMRIGCGLCGLWGGRLWLCTATVTSCVKFLG